MIILDNLGVNVKGRLWIDDLPGVELKCIKILEKNLTANQESKWHYRRVALELARRRHVSNYALLEAVFKPNDSKVLTLQVFVSEDLGEPMPDAQTMLHDKVRWGIPQQYSEAIINIATQNIDSNGSFPAGVLSFSVGAHAEAGSSNMIFSQVTQVLLLLISFECKDLSDDELKIIVFDAIQSGS